MITLPCSKLHMIQQPLKKSKRTLLFSFICLQSSMALFQWFGLGMIVLRSIMEQWKDFHSSKISILRYQTQQ